MFPIFFIKAHGYTSMFVHVAYHTFFNFKSAFSIKAMVLSQKTSIHHRPKHRLANFYKGDGFIARILYIPSNFLAYLPLTEKVPCIGMSSSKLNTGPV